MSMKNVKILLEGDGATGKTCALISYTENKFPVDYVPTVFDNFTTGIEVDGHLINLALWDSFSRSSEGERLRALGYPETDVFLLCFSVASPSSFESAEVKWAPRLKHHCPEAHIILLGTMIDLRGDTETTSRLKERGLSIISQDQAHSMASRIGAVKYMECSAKTQEGLKMVFDEAVRLTFGDLSSHKPANKRKPAKGCIVH